MTQSQKTSTNNIRQDVRSGISSKDNLKMDIPKRYCGKNLPQTQAAQRAVEIIKNGDSLFLTGAAGSGKTHLAVALANIWLADSLKLYGKEFELLPSKGYPFFLPAIELFLKIKAVWDADDHGISEKSILDQYSSCPLLILDDLGAEKISDWSRAVVFAMLDRRHRNYKKTIITSNLTIKQLAERFDARIASRIAEMGSVLNLGEKDFRLGNNTKTHQISNALGGRSCFSE